MLKNIRELHKLIKVEYDNMRTTRNNMFAHMDRDIHRQIALMKAIKYEEWTPVIAQLQLLADIRPHAADHHGWDSLLMQSAEEKNYNSPK